VTSVTSHTGVNRPDEAIRIASAYFDTKNYERAREVLRTALTQQPNDPALLIHYARAEYVLKNYSSAAWSAHAALAAAPQNEFATRIYALSLDGLGRSHEALWLAWQGVIAHPNEPLQHWTYAELLLKSRQFQSALAVVDGALRLDANHVDSLLLRGRVLHALGRLPESDESYRKALALDPGNAEAVNNLAVNRFHLGKFGRALRGFLGAAGHDPSLGNLARRNVGAVLVRVLRRATLLAVLLGILVLIVIAVQKGGHPTLAYRVATGLVTLALIAIFGWALRLVPRRVLGSVLRERFFVAVRAVHVLFAVILGAGVTGFGAPHWTMPAAMAAIYGGAFIAWVGRMGGT
jgi:tetratricopeptide (TPR) repeat protein